MTMALEGKVVMGTCGWSDESIMKTGFYPAHVKTAEDRLEIYSRTFPCVEVDSSCYAIPRPNRTSRWVEKTNPCFKFHFKAFGLFCSPTCPANALPSEVRSLVPADAITRDGRVVADKLPEEAHATLWQAFNDMLEPVLNAGRLGCVVFQFHISFKPSQANLAIVLRCRERLRSNAPMAIELRNRTWFNDEQWRATLLDALTRAQIALVAADELEHETLQTNLLPGQAPKVMTIAMHATTPHFFYVRLHRRQGTTERLLKEMEIQAWSERLASIAPHVKGPLYFMWGTDWRDVPMRNAAALQKALPLALRYDYAAIIAAQIKGRPGTLTAFFERQTKKARVDGPIKPMPNAAEATMEVVKPTSGTGNIHSDPTVDGDREDARPARADRAGANLIETEQAGEGSLERNQVGRGTDQWAAGPSRNECSGAGSQLSDQLGADPSEARPVGASALGTDPRISSPFGTDQVGSGPSTSERENASTFRGNLVVAASMEDYDTGAGPSGDYQAEAAPLGDNRGVAALLADFQAGATSRTADHEVAGHLDVGRDPSCQGEHTDAAGASLHLIRRDREETLRPSLNQGIEHRLSDMHSLPSQLEPPLSRCHMDDADHSQKPEKSTAHLHADPQSNITVTAQASQSPVTQMGLGTGSQRVVGGRGGGSVAKRESPNKKDKLLAKGMQLITRFFKDNQK